MNTRSDENPTLHECIQQRLKALAEQPGAQHPDCADVLDFIQGYDLDYLDRRNLEPTAHEDAMCCLAYIEGVAAALNLTPLDVCQWALS